MAPLQSLPGRAAQPAFTWRATLVAACLALGAGVAAAAETAHVLPPPPAETPAAANAAPQTIVFAGGCFWGVQAVFQHTEGVLQAVSGYAGGAKGDAVYERVGTGVTGHAESVEVRYDPKRVSYGRLLQIFFSVAHDPTQLDRQGPDRGSQYRSAIFYTSPAQKALADQYIAQLDAAHVYASPIVTRRAPLTAFYPAEGYHQDYATLHPDSGYIATFDLPKLDQLKALFPADYRAKPVLMAAKAAP